MENTRLTKTEQEFYNDKCFPKRWHAFFLAASMRIIGGVIVSVIVFAIQFLISNNIVRFSSEFGVDMFYAVLSQLCMVLPIPLALMFIAKNDIGETLRLKNDINVIQILLIVFMCISAFIPAQFINSLVISYGSVFFGPPQELSGAPNAQNIVQLLSEIVIIGFLPAICEEIFYRGYVLRGLERKGRVYALIVSSVLFAVMHANFQQMTYALMLGLLLGFVVLKTNSLYASIAMHATFNIMSVVLSYGAINEFYIAHNLIIVIIAIILAPAMIFTSIFLFNHYTNKRNARLNISNASPTFESIKEKKHEKVLSITWLILFLITNMYEAIIAW